MIVTCSPEKREELLVVVGEYVMACRDYVDYGGPDESKKKRLLQRTEILLDKIVELLRKK